MHYNPSDTTVEGHDNNSLFFFGKRYDEDRTVCYPENAVD